jgi:hypothetical protein
LPHDDGPTVILAFTLQLLAFSIAFCFPRDSAALITFPTAAPHLDSPPADLCRSCGITWPAGWDTEAPATPLTHA